MSELFSTINIVIVALVVAVILFVWHYMMSDSTVYIVRFARATCPYCVESQAEWDNFKAGIAVQKTWPVVVVDVDTADTESEITKKWTGLFKYESVPTVIKMVNGDITVYDGERLAHKYMRFVNNGFGFY